MSQQPIISEWNLNLLGIRDLRKLAFGLGVFSYTKYSKAELVQHIMSVVNGTEPPLIEIGRGRPSSINLSRKEAFQMVMKKLRTMEVATTTPSVHMVASSNSQYDIGERKFEDKVVQPKKQICFTKKANAPINVFAPIAFGSRVAICGSPNNLALAKKLVLSELSKRCVILLLPGETPEDIAEFKALGFPCFSSTLGDSSTKTIEVTKLAFTFAEQQANDEQDPIIVISSLSKLAKFYDQNAILSIIQDGDVYNKNIDRLAKLCLSANAKESGKTITLIAFAETKDKVDQILFEHLKNVFTTKIQLNEEAAFGEDIFPLDIKESYAKHANNFQKTDFAKKQKEVCKQLLLGEITNLEGLKNC